MSWFINLGINSSSSIGYRSQIAGSLIGKKTAAKKERKKQPLPLTDTEVKNLRAVYEAGGISQRELYDTYVKGKMTYSGMQNILYYITRTKI
jgi:hypothetical protein